MGSSTQPGIALVEQAPSQAAQALGQAAPTPNLEPRPGRELNQLVRARPNPAEQGHNRALAQVLEEQPPTG